MEYYTFSDLPADVKDRLVKSIAAVAKNNRHHKVEIDQTSFNTFILFEGYKIPFEFSKGDTE
jgi:hypothetical protein